MTATITKTRPRAKVTLPHQSIEARSRLASLLQFQVGPDGAEEPDRDRDQEDQAPVDRRQQAAEDQADEHAADPDDVVDPQRHASLVGGEGVGDDRRGVGEQAGAAHPLDECGRRSGKSAPARPVIQSIASISEATV